MTMAMVRAMLISHTYMILACLRRYDANSYGCLFFAITQQTHHYHHYHNFQCHHHIDANDDDGVTDVD